MNANWKKQILHGLALIVIGGWASHVRAECGIEDVVDLVERDYSNQEIRSECERKVVDAGSCTLTRVVSLAKRGKDAEDIQSACENGDGDRTPKNLDPSAGGYCCDPRSGMKVCRIVVNPGPPGQPCWCAGVPGVGQICN